VIYYIEDAGIFNERMDLRFDPSGTVTIVAGTFSHGQSHATTFAQCVSEWLGVPFENIRYIQGDTNQVAFGRGTYASRSAVVGSGALRGAADAVIEKGKKFAGFLMEASPADHHLRGRHVQGDRHRQESLDHRCGAHGLPAGRPAQRAWRGP